MCRKSSLGSCPRTRTRPSGSTRSCTRLPRACGWCPSSCSRSCPSRRSGCSARSAARTCRSSWPALGPNRAARRSAMSASCSRGSTPKRPDHDRTGGVGLLAPRVGWGRPVIDTHCHLDACEPPDASLVDHAREVGVTRIATVGTDGPSIERALRAARAHDGVVAIIGRHPHETAGFDAAGLDYYRDHAPQADQRRAFEAQLELAGRLGLPVAIHTRAAEEDTFAILRDHAASLPAVILHCFSAPARLAECVERRYMCSFAGNVTYPKATDLRGAARQVPAELLLVETDAPYLSPQPVRGKPNEPAHVAHTARLVAELRDVSYEELERTVEANAARVFQW